MRIIKTETKFVDWLFQELKRSEPQYYVDGSSLLVLVGICQGLFWNRCEAPLPQLSKILANSRTGVTTLCGAKLIKFSDP
jgi:hypothetical protein